MATVADALRYLISQAPGLSDTNRAELADAVDAEYGAVPVPAADAPALASDQAVADIAVKNARIAELEAELAALHTAG